MIRFHLMHYNFGSYFEIRQFKKPQNFPCLFQTKFAKISRHQNNPIYGTLETQLWSHILGPMPKLCMCQFGPVRMPGGPRKGHSWKFNPPPPSPLQIGSGNLVCNKKFFLTNRMHWSDLKGCMTKCCCFRFHFVVNIFTLFAFFCCFR